MATTVTALERSVKRAVQTELGKHKPDAYWIKTTSDQASGTPDLLICYRGLFIGMELKRPGEEPSEIQKHRLTQIVRAGGIACVVTNAVQTAAVLMRLDECIDSGGDMCGNAYAHLASNRANGWLWRIDQAEA